MLCYMLQFRPKRTAVIGDWRKLHNEELNNLNSLPDTIKMMKSMRTRWAGQVEHLVARTEVSIFCTDIFPS
jgi:hypothetical protein